MMESTDATAEVAEVKGPWEKAVSSMQLLISHGPFLARAKRKQRREESQLLPSFSFSLWLGNEHVQSRHSHSHHFDY